MPDGGPRPDQAGGQQDSAYCAYVMLVHKKLQNWDLDPEFLGIWRWNHGLGPPLPFRGSQTIARQPTDLFGDA